jgi:hypothetical protein
MRSRLMVVAAAIVTAFVLGRTGTAGADTHGWTISDGSAGNWSTGSNWSPAGPPASGDALHFLDKNQTEEIIVDQDADLSSVQVEWDYDTDVDGDFWTVNWTDDGNGRTVSVSGVLRILHTHLSSGSGTVTASLNTDGIHLRVGADGSPAVLEMASCTEHSTCQPQAYLVVAGGSVRAYLTELKLPSWRIHNNPGNAALADLNMSDCTDVLLAVSGDIVLGEPLGGERAYVQGTLRSGGGAMAVGGNLHLSDSNGENDWRRNGNSGRVYLTNTPLAVDGSALFYGHVSYDNDPAKTYQYRYAQVHTTVAGKCSGLDLTSSAASALQFPHGKQNNGNVDDMNRINITFSADPVETDADDWYWGMRWLGDHEGDAATAGTLEYYRNENDPRLVLDVSGLSDAVKELHLNYLKTLDPGTYGSYGIGDLTLDDYVVYDDPAAGGTGYTYVGVHYTEPPPVSEPARLSLLGFALLGLKRRRRN